MFFNFIYIIYELRERRGDQLSMQSTFLFSASLFDFLFLFSLLPHQASTIPTKPWATESSQRYLSSVHEI